MHLKPTLAFLTATILFPLGAGATGVHKCEATDRADWLSKADLTAKLEDEGWSIRFMKPDGGCWEVYGSTPEGERVEAYFHPVTGAPELIGQRGRILFKAEPEG